ncbi:Hypothetical predicted protein [Lecanosticta acicola]|uniref:2EXR domain-containing protein n=1 Tax=Lecanosticta acicola TaxID=111012 RepID=A0AAI8Z7J2_9PEZI|nr:Hypothetical predicted protein [Lecanosticta acicola]
MTPTDTITAVDKECSLLGLPAELRNRIYEMVLQEEQQIHVTKQGYSRSPFLSVCRQIRSEALKIFYYGNKFIFRAPGYDSDVIYTFVCILEQMEISRRKTTFSIRQSYKTANWPKLLKWLHRKHLCEAMVGLKVPSSLKKRGTMGAEPYVIGGMFNIVKEMKDQPWLMAMPILLQQRVVLEQLNKDWGKD